MLYILINPTKTKYSAIWFNYRILLIRLMINKTDLLEWARKLKRNILAVWLAARDARTPGLAKILALAVAGYALSPIDLIPDFIPILGYLDDLILLPIGIAVVTRLIPDDLMKEFISEANNIAAKPVSYTTAIFIVLLWIAMALGIAAIVTKTMYPAL